MVSAQKESPLLPDTRQLYQATSDTGIYTCTYSMCCVYILCTSPPYHGPCMYNEYQMRGVGGSDGITAMCLKHEYLNTADRPRFIRTIHQVGLHLLCRDQFVYSCGRSSSIWTVGQEALICLSRPRTASLARPKTMNPLYTPARQVWNTEYINIIYKCAVMHTTYIPVCIHMYNV